MTSAAESRFSALGALGNHAIPCTCGLPVGPRYSCTDGLKNS